MKNKIINKIIICAEFAEFGSKDKLFHYWKKYEACKVNTHFFPNTIIYLKKCNVIIAETGVGKIRATALVTFLLSNYDCKLLINIGLCGYCGNNCKIGDLIVINKVIQHDLYVSKEYMLSSPISLNHSYSQKSVNSLRRGTLFSGDQFISNIDVSFFSTLSGEKSSEFFVDMEGYALSYVAKTFKISCLVVKCISDNISFTAGNNNNFLEYQQSIRNENIKSKLMSLLESFISNT